ncbi:hypothetical protein E9531_13240 [Lampropedia puyangensis]|uniref:Uncharacterized protein n=1 Tax=Lampropedia puyangensis TaxID=1330072 RepID=A0A4S8EWW0_9BURK|nr:hypothetical protein [Lampropedia puyangensis]THT99036.1 hypothetical protein E9531_13240 [Lampropedia puyangensis]
MLMTQSWLAINRFALVGLLAGELTLCGGTDVIFIGTESPHSFPVQFKFKPNNRRDLTVSRGKKILQSEFLLIVNYLYIPEFRYLERFFCKKMKKNHKYSNA